MSGRLVALILGGAAVIFAAALWYFQNHAYYEEVEAEPLVIDGRVWVPDDWQGIAASSSPLKARSCFRIDARAAQALHEEVPSSTAANPLVAPYWFECFDAARIGDDLASGAATAVELGPTESDGIDAWVAIYPDGRAFGWRQVNAKYAQ